MPEDLAEARDLYLTAIANSVAAQDAVDAAEEAVHEANRDFAAADTEYARAIAAEETAGAAYRASLRSHGMVDTASGPAPAPGHYGPNDEERMIADRDRAARDLTAAKECAHCGGLKASVTNLHADDPDSAELWVCADCADL